MKIKIEVDIEWIEEDGSIDETVKQEIVDGVKRAISHQCMEKVNKEAKLAIDGAIANAVELGQAAIEERAKKFADDWLETQVVTTDKWGGSKTHQSIRQIVENQFDHLLEKNVDANGNFSTYSHSTKLMDWLTEKRLMVIVEKRLNGMAKDIDKSVSNAVNAGLRKQVADKFAAMVVTAENGSGLAKIE